MNPLPEVKRLRLENEIHAVLKEFFGPYKNAPQYVTDVENYMQNARLPFKPYNVLGIYFGNPQTDAPEGLRSLQGVVVEEKQPVTPPYFNYTMKKTEYLYTRVVGKPEEVIPAGYLAIFNYTGMHKVRAGSSGGHQHVTMADGQPVFEIYLEID